MESTSSVSLADLVDLIGRGGVVALLIAIVWGGLTERWVSGATYRRALRERDVFRDELMTVLRVADRATRLSERSFDVADSHLEAEKRVRVRNRDVEDEER
jgi:hypothetical protein